MSSRFFITVRWAALSGVSGVLAGTSASVFLFLLDGATRFRELHSQVIFLLPLGGFFIGYLYQRWGRKTQQGNNLVIDQILEPTERIPARMAPLVLLSTILTHFLGGSAGREGTAVQMGASLSDQLAHFFKVPSAERKILLITGAGAGFGAAIGAPWAGILFGMEMLQVGKTRWIALWQSGIASWTAFVITHFLHAPHTQYPKVLAPPATVTLCIGVLVLSLGWGFWARAFSWLMHHFEKWIALGLPSLPLRGAIGGVLILVLVFGLGTERYLGLGISVIQASFEIPAQLWDPILKLIFTLITLASGFKGGEFIPLVFMGSTLGSALSPVFEMPPALAGALGFAAVFGAASNTPLACTVMAMELFGWGIGPYAFVACWVSYWVSGNRGIYRSQRIHRSKPFGAL